MKKLLIILLLTVTAIATATNVYMGTKNYLTHIPGESAVLVTTTNGNKIVTKDAKTGKFYSTILTKEEIRRAMIMRADNEMNPYTKNRKLLDPKTTKNLLLKKMIEEANFWHEEFKNEFKKPSFFLSLTPQEKTKYKLKKKYPKRKSKITKKK